MRKRLVTLVAVGAGLLWGASPLLFFTQESYVQGLVDLLRTRPVWAVADLLEADHVVPWIWLMFVPKAVSTDALVWTVGLGLWLPNREGWPGSALAAFLSQRPVVGKIMLTLSDLLAGVLLSVGLVALARRFIGLIKPGG